MDWAELLKWLGGMSWWSSFLSFIGSVMGLLFAYLTLIVRKKRLAFEHADAREAAKAKAEKVPESDDKLGPIVRDPGQTERDIQKLYWKERQDLRDRIDAEHARAEVAIGQMREAQSLAAEVPQLQATIRRLRIEHENELRALGEAYEKRLDAEVEAAVKEAERKCEEAIRDIKEASPQLKLPPAKNTPGCRPALPAVVLPDIDVIEEDHRKTDRPLPDEKTPIQRSRAKP